MAETRSSCFNSITIINSLGRKRKENHTWNLVDTPWSTYPLHFESYKGMESPNYCMNKVEQS
jgi:hypothetical protein